MSDSQRWQRIEEILKEARSLGSEQRARLLERVAEETPDLLAEVKRRLAADRNTPESAAEATSGSSPTLVAGAPERRQADRRRMNRQSQPRDDEPATSESGRFLPGALLAGRYRIVSLLGEGAMGEVYRAQDLRLGQTVALKFLPASMGQEPSLVAHLLDEVRTARRLSHPNLCRVYDIGDFAGRQFLSMEYIDGETLASLLRRIGRLPHDKALEISRQLCFGLEAAHREGILHRDLKPANVMIDGLGRAKITDFGLAVVARELRAGDIQSGTPGYMAPEQQAGEAVSERSDLYSLGLVLHELFTGARAPRVGELRVVEGVDSAVEAAILACLEKNPERRPESARAVVRALPENEQGAPRRIAGRGRTRRLAVAAAVAVPILAATYWLGRDSRLLGGSELAAISAPSVAVLPFVDKSPDRGQQYFSDGMAEDLLNVLAQIPGLQVAARTSSFRFRDSTEEVASIGRQLNVSTLLEGSVRRAGNQVRVTAQLVNVADGFQLWSRTYTRDIDDIFLVQDEIVRSVAAALEVTLLGQAPARGPREENVEAYTLYLQGKQFLEQRDTTGLEQAALHFRKALELDPEHARSWAELARVHYGLANRGLVPAEEGWADAKAAAEMSLELDAALPEAWSVLGWISALYDWEWAVADQYMQRALALAPGSSEIARRAGVLAAILGRHDEAVALFQRAVRVDPLGVPSRVNHGLFLYYAGRYSDAEVVLQEALALSPDYPTTHLFLGLVYLAQKRPDDGLEAFEHETVPSLHRFGKALALFALERWEAADAVLAQMIERDALVSASKIAEVYVVRGEFDRAYEWLERAYAQRDSGIADLSLSPNFDSVREEPRFQGFLEKVGLGRGRPTQ